MRMKDAFVNNALLVVVLCMTDEGLMFVNICSRRERRDVKQGKKKTLCHPLSLHPTLLTCFYSYSSFSHILISSQSLILLSSPSSSSHATANPSNNPSHLEPTLQKTGISPSPALTVTHPPFS